MLIGISARKNESMVVLGQGENVTLIGSIKKELDLSILISMIPHCTMKICSDAGFKWWALF